MNDDEPLDARLAELARADARLAAPADLEARVLAAWERERRAGRLEPPPPRASTPIGRRLGTAAAWAGVAAAAVVAVALVRLLPVAAPGEPRTGLELESDASRDRTGGVEVPAPPPSPVPVAAERSDDRRPAARLPSSRPGRLAAPRPLPEAPVDATELPAPSETAPFLPLGPDVERELAGTFQLARVRVSRDVLVDLGLLMEGHRGGEPLQADVVFSEDGLARAIRLVPASRRMP